jgi:hypothetical protein
MISTIILTTILLRRRGTNWIDLGLRRPKKLWLTPLQAVVVFVGTVAVAYLAKELSDAYFVKPDSSVTRFGNLKGNIWLTTWWISLGWISGAFFEEMLFRGFLLTQFEAMIGSVRISTSIAIVLQAAIFALAHFYYKGAYGAIPVFASAVFVGICYVKFDRNLWPLVLSHGTMNTLGFVAKYLHGQPG